MITGNFTIDASHPCLEGHFPGNPVVPGVVILDEVSVIARPLHPQNAAISCPAVKFIQPVLPGQSVDVKIESGSETSARFYCSMQGQPCAEGRLSWAAA